MNLLLDYDRAIISEKEGTTTDFITESVILDGNNITLIDTAGLNTTTNLIEKKGIERSISIINSASLLLFITTVNGEFTDSELSILKDKNIVVLLNKKDIQSESKKEKKLKELSINYKKISALNINSRDIVEDELNKTVSSIIKNMDTVSVIKNTRQERLMEKVLLKLKSINTIELYEEVLSLKIKEILNLLREFTGEFNTEQLLDEIFSEFCIGK